MSIRPIDYQMTYNNTINEAKDKQNEFNKTKDTHYFAENQQKHDDERNKARIQDSKETNGKNIKRDARENRENKNGFSKKNRKPNLNKKVKNDKKVSSMESKGCKIDIFI